MNKKAIGFGLWIVLITFILFALVIANSVRTYNQAQQTLGTWGLSYTADRPLEANRIFLDTMNLGVDKSIRDLAKDSFVNKSNSACSSTPDGIVILDENCKPEREYIKNMIAQNVTKYFKDSFEKYAAEYHLNIYQLDLSSVTCQFVGDTLNCASSEQAISYEKKTPYFSYKLDYKFKVNQSVNIDEKLNLDELENLDKEDPTQLSLFDKWEKVEVQEDFSHYIVILKSKGQIFNLETYQISPVDLVFALRKPSQRPLDITVPL